MLCFRDKSFCKLWKECKDGHKCDRAYTPQVNADAEKWWEGFNSEHGPPINFYDYTDTCFKPITK